MNDDDRKAPLETCRTEKSNDAVIIGEKMRDNIDPVNLEIGMRIKGIRTRKGWSQKILAKSAGITIQSVLYVEKGKRGLSSHTIRNISNALEVTTDYILFGRTGLTGESGIDYFIATGLSDVELDNSLEVFSKAAEILRRYKEAREALSGGLEDDEDGEDGDLDSGDENEINDLDECETDGKDNNEEHEEKCEIDGQYEGSVFKENEYED